MSPLITKWHFVLIASLMGAAFLGGCRPIDWDGESRQIQSPAESPIVPSCSEEGVDYG